jgi:hypothetical protein
MGDLWATYGIDGAKIGQFRGDLQAKNAFFCGKRNYLFVLKQRSIFVRLVREGRNVRIQSGLKEEKEQDRGGNEADRVAKVCDTCGARDSR